MTEYPIKYDIEKLKEKDGKIPIQNVGDRPSDYGLKTGDTFFIWKGKKKCGIVELVDPSELSE